MESDPSNEEVELWIDNDRTGPRKRRLSRFIGNLGAYRLPNKEHEPLRPPEELLPEQPPEMTDKGKKEKDH